MKTIFKLIRNNFFFFKIAFKASPLYIIGNLLLRIIIGVRTFYMSVFFLIHIIDSVEQSRGKEYIILFTTVSFMCVSFTYLIEMLFKHIYVPVVREDLSRRLQKEVFGKIVNLDAKFFDSKDTYNAVILSNNECTDRFVAVTDNIFQLVEVFITIIVIIAYSLTLDFILLLFVVVSFVLTSFFNAQLTKTRVQKDTEMIMKSKEDNFLHRTWTLPEYAEDIRCSSLCNILNLRFHENLRSKQQIIKNHGRKIAMLSFVNVILSDSLIMDMLIPLYLAFRILVLKNMRISSFLALINGGTQIKYKADDLSNALAVFTQNALFIQRYRDFFTLRSEIEISKSENSTLSVFKSLKLHHVEFQYPDMNFGLKDINFEICKGDRVAIVGRNGSGKTSLLKLILRLYDPESGEIYYNGKIIKNLDIHAYRSLFSVLTQDYKIYSDTVSHNIALSRDIDVTQIQYATGKTQINTIIENLPQKYHTQMTKEFFQEGINFSGGQDQRLALSRIFYQNHPIYVLDEPTSAMDVFYEQYFNSLVRSESEDKTIIFISHRFSSVKECNKIIYMENGKIVEMGTHSELIANKGGYYQLYTAQAELYDKSIIT